jgi:hypothetical protein
MRRKIVGKVVSLLGEALGLATGLVLVLVSLIDPALSDKMYQSLVQWVEG